MTLSKSLTWSSLDVFLRFGVQFAVSLALARLLSPSEFGLFGIIGIFSAIAMTCVDCGFGNALIQRPTVTEDERTSVFCLNIAAGLIVASILALVAPTIAQFYAEPILTPITRVMALNIVIGSLGSTQMALLAKEMRFKPSFFASAASVTVASCITLALALLHYGVWSLVAQLVVGNIVSTATIWHLSPWKPSGRFSFAAVRSMLPFSSKLFASSLLDTVFDRAQSAVIGKAYSVADLGFYTRAANTQALPVGLLTNAVQRVGFPYFSKLSGDLSRMRWAVREILCGLAFVTAPILIFLACSAHAVILTLFGPKWLPCVPYLQILSIAGILWPFHVVNLHALLAMGRSDIFFWLETAKKALGITVVAITFRYGVDAIAWGAVVISIGCALINTHHSGRELKYTVTSQFVDMLQQALPAAFAGIVLFWLGAQLVPLNLATSVALFMTVWLIAGYVWPSTRLTQKTLVGVALRLIGRQDAVLPRFVS